MKLIFKIYNMVYKYLIEPFLVAIIILIGLGLHAKTKLKKIVKKLLSSDTLFTCFLLSSINRAILRSFCVKLGFDSLLAILLLSILGTLFKIIVVVSRDEKCSIEKILTTFTSTFGVTLLLSYINTLLKIL